MSIGLGGVTFHTATWDFQITSAPQNPSYYWSFQFLYEHSQGGTATGGYIGFQPNGNAGPVLSPLINFAMWGATSATAGPNGGAQQVTDGGSAERVYERYSFLPNVTYHLELQDTNGSVTAYVTDTTTGVRELVGAIQDPGNIGALTAPQIWTEIYAGLISLSQAIRNEATWSNFVFDGVAYGTRNDVSIAHANDIWDPYYGRVSLHAIQGSQPEALGVSENVGWFSNGAFTVITSGQSSDTLNLPNTDSSVWLDAGDYVVNCGAGNDVVRGGVSGKTVVNAGDGNDVVYGGGGDDIILGGNGVDTAIYTHAMSAYSITVSPSGRYTILDRTSNGDGRDTLVGVEFAQFADGRIDLLHSTAIPTTVLAPSASEPLAIDYQVILRSSPSDNATDADFVNGLIFDVQTTHLTLAAAVAQEVGWAKNTSSVATLAYEFFTGAAPSAAGMDYLVSPSGPNPNNLNAPYYQSFSLENRYINFAVNLGKVGEGNASFTQHYGSLSLFEATRQAYATIFGGTPSDAKLHALLDPSTVLNGQTFSRADYFAYYGQDGPNGIGTKAAMVGWLMAEAEKADVGTYALSNDAFLTDVALHNAPFGVDIIGHYNQPGFAFLPG